MKTLLAMTDGRETEVEITGNREGRSPAEQTILHDRDAGDALAFVVILFTVSIVLGSRPDRLGCLGSACRVQVAGDLGTQNLCCGYTHIFLDA